MTFKQAVKGAPPPVDDAYRNGIQALNKGHRKYMECSDANRLTGSIDLDAALRQVPEHASASRWDYGIGYRPKREPEQAVWVEVHSANTSQVSVVLRKLQWLRDWLNGDDAEQLKQMTDAADSGIRFVWVASNGVKILKNSPQSRRLSMSGIGNPVPRLQLP